MPTLSWAVLSLALAASPPSNNAPGDCPSVETLRERTAADEACSEAQLGASSRAFTSDTLLSESWLGSRLELAGIVTFALGWVPVVTLASVYLTFYLPLFALSSPSVTATDVANGVGFALAAMVPVAGPFLVASDSFWSSPWSYAPVAVGRVLAGLQVAGAALFAIGVLTSRLEHFSNQRVAVRVWPVAGPGIVGLAGTFP